MNANCKVLVRMVRQQLNKDQWNDYNIFWKELMSPEKGDDVIGLDIHNTGGKVVDYDKMRVSNFEDLEQQHWDHYIKSTDSGDYIKLTTPKDNSDKVYIKAHEVEDLGGCPDLFSRFSIFASGDVALCSADQAEYFKLGNVIKEDPIEIFNNNRFTDYRNKWMSKEYKKLEHCRDCSIYMMRFHKSYVS